MGERVGVLIDGEVTVHAAAPAAGGYDTLCGLDANDDVIGHDGTVKPGRRRINCAQCLGIWNTARRYRARDFRPATKDNGHG